MRFLYRVLVLFTTLLVGCSGLVIGGETPIPQKTAVPSETPTPPDVSTQIPTDSPTPGPVMLRIWVPPQFDPASGTPAGDLLQARLDEFVKRRPGVKIEVRVKAVDGPGGLLDSLTTTTAAAPLALPDLIALPRGQLEIAALKGLLHPFDNLTETLDDSDWYEYARQLARLENSTFGLPFAGDAMIMVYRPEIVPDPPSDWPATLESNVPLVFPAADPLALFTLTLYQASGGAVRNDQGQPFLDAGVLTTVLTFYLEAEQNDVMPYWVTQYQSDDQVWETFLEGNADLVAIWSTRYLRDLSADSAAASIPTSGGTPFTLATGWAWALSSPQAERQELGVELAEFLTDDTFLARWTQAVGYLPTRPSALIAWRDEALRTVMNQVLLSADSIPSDDVLVNLGVPLQQAVVQVLKEQSDPFIAAQAAVDTVTGKDLTGP